MDNRTETVMVRMTKAEKRAAEAKANAKGLSLSAWLRMLAAMAAVLLVVGCGQNDPQRSGLDAMWTSSGGILSCVGATPEPYGDRMTCTWACVEVDGQDLREAMLTFSRSAAGAEWELESTYRDIGTCP